MQKKNAIAILLAAAVVALAVAAPAPADERSRGYAYSTDVSETEMVAAVRARGLSPLGRPVRNGDLYIVRALDPRGVEYRIVADVASGDILAVTPSRAAASVLRYDNSPRIIHVPQPGEPPRRSLRGNDKPGDDDVSATGDEDVAPLPPPRHKVVAPPPHRRSDAPPPPAPGGPKRELLSAPPPSAEVRNPGLSPIKPTPRWRAGERSGEVDSPADKIATSTAAAAMSPAPPADDAAAAHASSQLPIGTEEIPGEGEPPAAAED